LIAQADYFNTDKSYDLKTFHSNKAAMNRIIAALLLSDDVT
jgi:hypothetical protein